MAWLGWALAAMGFMGLANLGMKAAGQRGLEPASVLFWVVLGEVPVAGEVPTPPARMKA